MLRTECEEAILSKLIEIKNIAKTYDNNLEYLSLNIFNDDVIFHNNYWEGHKKICVPDIDKEYVDGN